MKTKLFLAGFFLVPLFAFGILYAGRENIIEVLYPQYEHHKYLRESYLDSCRLLIYQKPDVLILGSSEAYTAFDFPSVQSAIAPTKLGTCMLSGMNIVAIPDILQVLLSQGHKYKTLVFSVNRDMFRQLDQHDLKKAFEVARFVSEMNPGYLSDLGHFFKHRMRPKVFKVYPEFEDDLKKMDPAFIHKLLVREADADPLQDLSAGLSSLCGQMKSLAEKVIINHIPSSPVLEREYANTFEGQYQKILEGFRSCGFQVITSREFPNTDLYFANRGAKPDRTQALLTQNLEGQDPELLVDTQHFNYVGAREYTKWWLSNYRKLISW